MKSIYKRLIAYLVDILIISVITMSITYLPIFKNDLSNYRKYLKEYNKEYTTYLSFNRELTKFYKDNELSDKEYHKLCDKYNDYTDSINKYYKDNKLTKKDYKKLTSEIDNNWSKSYKRYNYRMNKYSLVSNISSFVVILLYFLGLNIFMNGQTIGKKVMKLQIVSNDDADKVSIINYLIRALILYNPIYYLAIVLGLYIFNVNSFYSWSYVWSDIKSYLEIIIIFMIIVRKDNRGLHEMLSKTKVISVDNKEISNEKKENEVTVIKKDNSKKKRKSNKGRKIVVDEE